MKKLTFLLTALLLQSSALLYATTPEAWVPTWMTAEVGRPPQTKLATEPPNSRCKPSAPQPQFTNVTNQTLRQIVHTSLGGSKAVVVLSNAFGTAPVKIGAAAIALRDKAGKILPGTSQPLTFSGQSTISIPMNALMYSDPVALRVPPMADLAIDLYLPETTDVPATLTMHFIASQTNYISTPGNHVAQKNFPAANTMSNWVLLSRVDVLSSEATGAIVAFGDSIIDGVRSTIDTNSRWPDYLARRLSAAGIRKSVLNAGISSNRVLSEPSVAAGTDARAIKGGINALARFEHDVLAKPGVTHVIVMEGINDIGNAYDNPTPTADDIIAGYKQLIARAHAHGIKIFGATLTPFWGAGYYSEVGEAKRQAVNNWLRSSHLYDGFIDFDKVIRDPKVPKKLLEKYDSCDYLHPSDAGYKAMADAIDLSLFAPHAN